MQVQYLSMKHLACVCSANLPRASPGNKLSVLTADTGQLINVESISTIQQKGS
jgi:hypothetical protein